MYNVRCTMYVVFSIDYQLIIKNATIELENSFYLKKWLKNGFILRGPSSSFSRRIFSNN
jgi:hypothetical protein